MLKVLMLFFACLLGYKSYSQVYYMDTVNQSNKFDKILVLKEKDINGDVLITKFEKSLILYNDYSYYIDPNRKEIFFLGSILQSVGVEGKIDVRYCLEKYSIANNSVIYESCFTITVSSKNRVQYFLSNKGFVIKTGNDDLKEIELIKVNHNERWWD